MVYFGTVPIEFASFITDFWDDLVAEQREGLFLVLLGFIGAFAFIRMSTRIMRSPRVAWWPGSISTDGGVHIHHLVFGIVAMMAAGSLAITVYDVSPWFEICAVIFGIGIGLTIDEFSLWVRLEDVYWAEDGRRSIDATVIAALLMALVLVGSDPFDFDTASTATLIASISLTLFIFLLLAICFMKGRVAHGAIGLFVFPVAIYGASRIGKPRSAWARRFYGDRKPKKQAKAVDRFRADRRTERFKNKLRDAIGGTTTEVYEETLERRGGRPPEV